MITQPASPLVDMAPTATINSEGATPVMAPCYFLVRQQQGRCDQLLSNSAGQLQLLDQQQLHLLRQGIGQPLAELRLGADTSREYWVVVCADQELAAEYQWQGLRSFLEQLNANLFALAGRALQIAQWFFDHRYCGRCGQATSLDPHEHARICTPCQLRFYPRINPCMIVLVTRGDELLLAHHVRASRPVYTTLAGFVEAGERVEETIRREVMEEVGIQVGSLEYFTSQSWPFPGQLMLGFFAAYTAGELMLDKREIVDANWFRYDCLPPTPPLATVAGQLINAYVQRCKDNNKARGPSA